MPLVGFSRVKKIEPSFNSLYQIYVLRSYKNDVWLDETASAFGRRKLCPRVVGEWGRLSPARPTYFSLKFRKRRWYRLLIARVVVVKYWQCSRAGRRATPEASWALIVLTIQALSMWRHRAPAACLATRMATRRHPDIFNSTRRPPYHFLDNSVKNEPANDHFCSQCFYWRGSYCVLETALCDIVQCPWLSWLFIYDILKLSFTLHYTALARRLIKSVVSVLLPFVEPIGL